MESETEARFSLVTLLWWVVGMTAILGTVIFGIAALTAPTSTPSAQVTMPDTPTVLVDPGQEQIDACVAAGRDGLPAKAEAAGITLAEARVKLYTACERAPASP